MNQPTYVCISVFGDALFVNAGCTASLGLWCFTKTVMLVHHFFIDVEPCNKFSQSVYKFFKVLTLYSLGFAADQSSQNHKVVIKMLSGGVVIVANLNTRSDMYFTTLALLFC